MAGRPQGSDGPVVAMFGGMNAIEMLTKQHRQIEDALEGITRGERSTWRARLAEATDLLMSHVLVEEQCFYPSVKAKRTEDILLESLEEHLSLKRLIADLLELSPDDDQFEPKLHVLREQGEHHHEEEEEKLFPAVKKLLTAEELRELGEAMGVAQGKLLRKKPRAMAATQTDKATDL